MFIIITLRIVIHFLLGDALLGSKEFIIVGCFVVVSLFVCCCVVSFVFFRVLVLLWLLLFSCLFLICLFPDVAQ